MYLLHELERAVERPTVVWSIEMVAGVQRRLDGLLHVVRQIAARSR
jgi:hypothetical protein